MPRCQPISMLELDDRSREGLKRIKQLEDSARLSSAVLSGGQIMLLFFKQTPPEAIINITTNDWELFFAALKSLPKAFHERIIQEAQFQQLDHQDYTQSQFWKGVSEGCLEITK